MANTYTTLDGLFTGIADAIRLKNGSTETIIADTFPNEISNLRIGFDYINHNVIIIEDYQFKNCTDLKNVDCYSIKSIGASAFEGCSELKTIVLYDGVQSIGENAFKGCSSLTIYCMFDSQPDTWHVNWNPDECKVIWLGGAVETWDISATENDNVIAKLYNDIGNEEYYKLIISGRGNMKNYSYTSFCPYNRDIKTIIISNGVTNIGNYAFNNTRIQNNLITVFISNSVTSIGICAFEKCINLKNITMSNNITSIGSSAFRSCKSITYITIPNSVISIDSSAFSYCESLTNVTIPNSVININQAAFSNCSSLEFINIPNSVISIGASAFNNCYSLEFINIPSSVINIGGAAFDDTAYYENASNWINSVLYIDNALIEARESISGDYIVKNGTTVIAGYAFNDCESLASITIPDSVTNICGIVFHGCKSLTIINYSGTVLQWNSITLNSAWDSNTPDYTIYCIDGTISKDGIITYYSTGGES